MANINAETAKFFKKEDVTSRGEDIPLTIAGSERLDIGKGDDRDTKRVVYFEEDPRGVVLNKSRAFQLVDITGSEETDDWVGKKVLLTVDPSVMFQGKKVGGLAFVAPE